MTPYCNDMYLARDHILLHSSFTFCCYLSRPIGGSNESCGKQFSLMAHQCWCRRLQTKLVQLSEMEMHC